MTIERIYEIFCENFPQMKNQVLKYYNNSRHEPNSIKIWLKNYNKLIFSVNDGGFTLRKG